MDSSDYSLICLDDTEKFPKEIKLWPLRKGGR